MSKFKTVNVAIKIVKDRRVLNVGGGMGVLGVFEKVKRGVGKCVGVWGEVRGDVGGGMRVFENVGKV